MTELQLPWPRVGQTLGLGENAVFLVLAPTGTARAALSHHLLAALVEGGLALCTPGESSKRCL